MPRPVTVKEAIKRLEDSGFEKKSQRGSHIKYCKDNICINVVMHSSPKETLSVKLAREISKLIEKTKQS